jgi:methanol metabolism-related c-type cytochrome
MRYKSALALLGAVGAVTLVLTRPAPAQNDPVYVVHPDGKTNLAVFNGYRRYGESCMRCHGPDGAGSSYAPDLTRSLKTMTYLQFATTVANGRKDVTTASENVMPAFGTVPDVMLYINDIYGYLKARSDGKLGRGRPARFDDNG